MTRYDLRRRIKAVRKSGGSRYPQELRDAVLEYAELRQADGHTFNEVAGELGLNWHTMMGWRKRSGRSGKLRKVKIVEPPPPEQDDEKAPMVRFPNGVTVEGLGIDQIAALMRSLS
jgi:hypothetical protein